MKRKGSLFVRMASLILTFVILITLVPSPVEGKSLTNGASIGYSIVGNTSFKTNLYETLQQKAQQDGSVRVIIRLNVPFVPEGELSAPSVQGQRSGIAQVQEAVATSLESFNANVLRQYKYVPLMVVTVDSSGLADLAANPDVIMM